MPSAEGNLHVFQVSSIIAVFGFIILATQTVIAEYKKRKSQTKADNPVTLSAVTSGDEPPKVTTTTSLQEPQEPKLDRAALAIGTFSYTAALVAFIEAQRMQSRVFGPEGADLARFNIHGEPRVTYLCPGVFAPVMSEALRAVHFVVAILSIILGMVRSVVMLPADVAFGCLASISLLFGVPLSVVGVATVSFLAITAMTILAAVSSLETKLNGKQEDIDEQG